MPTSITSPTPITSPTSITGSRTTPRCAEIAGVFQDQLLEEPLTTGASAALRRRQLDITVEPESFDTLAGVTRGNRQVNHSEVVRLRNANPHESLDQLAQRLDCSLSTVKRHLRRERREPTARTTTPKPTVAEVLAAAATVTSSSTGSRRPQAA